ncbi:uncharacterized protein LOC112567600 [Pomacea canaliculata]|uniref:uncharacterized protein LOC112567600 n=1 Tax=Pomacea canaliculata TaxID=400727 RepID=UPI000D729865|nr:uncharacterized protein LOC112567600 [Pomacea canaliculata]
MMNNTTFKTASPSSARWGNSLEILSMQDYQLTLFVLHCVVKPVVVVVVGVPSNIISCVVFWRQGLGDRMNVCLLALSLVDLCFLLVSMAYSVGYYLGQVDPVRYGGVYDLLLAFIAGVNHGFRSASGCITMVIAVERCLCVVFPLKATSLISSRNMAVIMIFIVCFTQIGFFTTPARFVVNRVNNGSSKFVLVASALYTENQAFFNILESIVMMCVLPLTTFLVTCVSTVLTVVKLRAAMTWREQVIRSKDKGQSHQHTALTKMLVVVSCVYILTTIPWIVVYLASFLEVRGVTVSFPSTSSNHDPLSFGRSSITKLLPGYIKRLCPDAWFFGSPTSSPVVFVAHV